MKHPLNKILDKFNLNQLSCISNLELAVLFHTMTGFPNSTSPGTAGRNSKNVVKFAMSRSFVSLIVAITRLFTEVYTIYKLERLKRGRR